MGNCLLFKKGTDASLLQFTKYGKYTIIESGFFDIALEENSHIKYADPSSEYEESFWIVYAASVTINYDTGDWSLNGPITDDSTNYIRKSLHLQYPYFTINSDRYNVTTSGTISNITTKLYKATSVKTTKPIGIWCRNYITTKRYTNGSLIEYIFANNGSYPDNGISGEYWYKKE